MKTFIIIGVLVVVALIAYGVYNLAMKVLPKEITLKGSDKKVKKEDYK